MAEVFNKAVAGSLHVDNPQESTSWDGKKSAPDLKLGRDGLPLVPQPSDHKEDPLVSPARQRSPW
jgi:hypothetical protein